MKIPDKTLRSVLFAAAVAMLPISSRADTITFAEFDGLANGAAMPTLPEGVPVGVTASWVGFVLHTTAGATPMSVYPTSTQAVVAFSPPVIVSSINLQDTTNGGPVTVIGKLRGIEVWRYSSPGDHDWAKITAGVGKEVDSVVFNGRANYIDDLVVDGAPDTDGDGYTDADEVATGHDPKDAGNNPAASAIADSIAQWSTSGTQGENGWYYGYRNVTKDGGGQNYDQTKGFIEFPPEAWAGAQWDLNTAAAAPWTEVGTRNVHPNAGTGDINWPIRRWVASQLTKVTPLAVRWHTHHGNVTCGGNGITGALYRNGQVLESIAIAAPDNVGVTHTYYVNVSPGDRIDLALSAKGANGVEADGCDGSENWFLVDTTIPTNAVQPDGSVFIPAGAGDSDADGLPDVWEKIYFPSDLTKLSRTGDYDKDGLSDLGEYQRTSDPTKTDSDADGLSDLAETATGVFISKADTGSSPIKKDTDGDGLNDDVEVNRTPPTNPNKADTDADGYSDPEEASWSTDPTNPKDNPTTYVIANSQAQFSGVQGQNDWYGGYRVFDPSAGSTNYSYNANTDFIPFAGGEGGGTWDGVGQTWTGSSWDLNTASAGPWSYEAALDLHPNGAGSPPDIGGVADPANEQWVIRRWVAKKLTKDTQVTIIWQVKKTNLAGNGVSGLLFINGKLVDFKAIAGTDGAGEIRRYRATLKPNDIVDLALSPEGPTGNRADGSDGSQTWFWVDARPVAADLTITGLTFKAAEGKFSFKWASQAGAKYTVLVSTDLVKWTALPTVDSAGTETTFTQDLNPSVQARFYRVSQ